MKLRDIYIYIYVGGVGGPAPPPSRVGLVATSGAAVPEASALQTTVFVRFQWRRKLKQKLGPGGPNFNFKISPGSDQPNYGAARKP